MNMAKDFVIFPTTTPASLSPALLQKQHQWPVIARDLALLTCSGMGSTYSIQDIAKAYDVSLMELQILIEMPVFQKYVKEEKNKIEAEPHGGSKVRAETMAVDLQEVLYLRAKEGTLTDIVTLKFLEHLAKVSGLDDSKDKNTNINQNAINVTVNVPKLNNPKLAHLYPAELEYEN